MLLSMQIAVSTTMYMVLPFHPWPAPNLHARFLQETSCSQVAPPTSFSDDIHNCLLLPSPNTFPRHCLIFQMALFYSLCSYPHKSSLPTRRHSIYNSLFLYVSATGCGHIQRAANFFVEVCSLLKMVISCGRNT
jgi:hypothetical protein